VTAVDSWGIPLDVTFEPKHAQITGVRMGLVVDGEPIMSNVDLSAAIASRSDGQLHFSDVVVPRIPATASQGKVGLVVELAGTVDGRTATSDAADGVISFNGSDTFVPLFLAGDELGTGRRYGQAAGEEDPGGDSWATFKTINWLKSNGYRFNDVSALHVAQTASGRSVLDHAGHSDGAQLDLRYADGSGGYADELGGMNQGSHIKSMLDAAAAQAASGGNGPSTARAIAWVKANRAMLESESGAARKLHAGDGWMQAALLDGNFPNGMPIPGLGPWTTKPQRLTFAPSHYHHWHISLKP